jgi:hypothetical protein
MLITSTIEERGQPVADLPPSGPSPTLDHERLRRKVLGDLLTEEEICNAIPDSRSGKPKSRRQIRRLVAKGMPYVRIGRERMYDPPKVREWLGTQTTSRCEPPRRPGKRAHSPRRRLAATVPGLRDAT